MNHNEQEFHKVTQPERTKSCDNQKFRRSYQNQLLSLFFNVYLKHVPGELDQIYRKLKEMRKTIRVEAMEFLEKSYDYQSTENYKTT